MAGLRNIFGPSVLLLAVLAPGAPDLATVELILDLRTTGGGKSALVNATGDSVGLELYALVRDSGGSPDGFNASQGAWQSDAAGLKGNLAASLASGFDLFGSSNPAPADLDSDGDLDVGALPTAASGHWIASAGVDSSFVSSGTETIGGQTFRKFLIGTAVFTVSDVWGVETHVNYIPRTGGAPVFPHKYQSDSAMLESVRGDDPRLQTGNPAGSGVLITGPTIWNGGAGNWSTGANWNSALVPNNGASVYNVLIDNNSSSSAAVTLDINATVNKLTLAGGDVLNIPVGRSLTINNGALINGEIGNSGTLALTGAATQIVGTISGAGALTNDSTLTFATGASASLGNVGGSGSLTVDATRTLTVNQIRQTSLTVTGSVITRSKSAGGGTSAVSSLSFGPSGNFDISNNALIVTGQSPTQVSSWISSGRITSSAATSRVGVAVATAGETAKTIFGGIPINPNDILIMYTYRGDADLSGNIDGDDFFQIDQGFTNNLTSYFNGDFNYSGNVDADDYWIIDSNYGIRRWATCRARYS
jgi:hypothetical protein